MMLSEFIIVKIVVIICCVEAYNCLFLTRCWGLRLGYIVVVDHQWTSDQLLIAVDLTVQAIIVWTTKQLVKIVILIR